MNICKKKTPETRILLVHVVTYQFEGVWSWWCFNATFNNISVIWWWSVLLIQETGEPGENHRPVASR